MTTLITRFKLPVYHYILGGLVPAVVVGLLGGALIEMLLGGVPFFAQIVRALALIAAAFYGARLSARYLAARGIISAKAKEDAWAASVLFGAVHVILLPLLVYAGIASSGATALLPYFWIMVLGNGAALWTFYGESRRYLRLAASVAKL